MPDPVEALLVDLLVWISHEDRTYGDVIEAWRTSCPRLPVWEEANARGLILRCRGADGEAAVRVSPLGQTVLSSVAACEPSVLDAAY